MMDGATISRFRSLCVSGVPSKAQVKQFLTSNEEKARELACASNLRLEQERIPNQFATTKIKTALLSGGISIEV